MLIFNKLKVPLKSVLYLTIQWPRVCFSLQWWTPPHPEGERKQAGGAEGHLGWFSPPSVYPPTSCTNSPRLSVRQQWVISANLSQCSSGLCFLPAGPHSLQPQRERLVKMVRMKMYSNTWDPIYVFWDGWIHMSSQMIDRNRGCGRSPGRQLTGVEMGKYRMCFLFQ